MWQLILHLLISGGINLDTKIHKEQKIPEQQQKQISWSQPKHKEDSTGMHNTNYYVTYGKWQNHFIPLYPLHRWHMTLKVLHIPYL